MKTKIKDIKKFNVADFNWQCTCGTVVPIYRGVTETVTLTLKLQEDACITFVCPHCKKQMKLFMSVNKNTRG